MIFTHVRWRVGDTDSDSVEFSGRRTVCWFHHLQQLLDVKLPRSASEELDETQITERWMGPTGH